VDFVTRQWQPVRRGALETGLRHGAVCVGCCRVVRELLFLWRCHELYWIAGIATRVLLEKLLPAGARPGSVSGIVSIVGGLWLSVA
jgi:predicted metal-binding membrane protein